MNMKMIMNMNMGGCDGKLKFQQQTQQPAACYKVRMVNVQQLLPLIVTKQD